MTTTQTVPTVPGTPFEGGYYAGRFQLDGQQYALIVSPKAAGQVNSAEWGNYGNSIPATSCNDGLANTQAMAEAGSDLAKQMLALDINGNQDWYLPSRDELELCYRNLKPTEEQNYCTFRDGDNPSSLPAGYPYTATSPGQCADAAFQQSGEQAFDDAWHWSSTQYSPTSAWIQHFGDGIQGSDRKDYALRARAVRRFIINSAL
ncbi:MAG: DUF1566 domain-containing protein [Gammaproteobacteria bacterium HGW-Gammaproteobacteria-11]|nr:MAG: DUF1566 domain-containing protein [Gammaproteobacteria bacterium HGW-Gammaproteobacteria-11]